MDNGHQYVGAVLEKSYRIPTFQRGYRWTKDNVDKLLQDVYEDRLLPLETEEEKEKWNELTEENALEVFRAIAFEEADTQKPKSPYCIQPLVTQRIESDTSEDRYDVIDGQQRLTTIVLIRAALNKVFNLELHPVSICYESRRESEKFLADFYSEQEKSHVNIDFAYMQQSYDTAVEFFENLCGNDDVKKQYGQYLDDILCHNTHFIWYQVDEGEPQRIFGNFNTGKMELTNAELIKALFMNPIYYGLDSVKDKQILIAEKWDEMERKLNDPDFWAFVPHSNQYSLSKESEDRKGKIKDKVYDTRLDLLFELLVMDIWMEKNRNNSVDAYYEYRNSKVVDNYTFNEIEQWITNEIKNAEDRSRVMIQCWRRIEIMYSVFCEFYSNNEMYNHVGLLINLLNRTEANVDEYKQDDKTYLEVYQVLKKIAACPRERSVSGEQQTRLQKVKEEIEKNVFESITNTDISGYIRKVRYNDQSNPPIIVKLLLLYNIAKICSSKGTGERFNYLETANMKWQREHVFAQKAAMKSDEHKIILEIMSGDSYVKYLNYLAGRADDELCIENEETKSATDARELAKKGKDYYSKLEELEHISSEKDDKWKKKLQEHYVEKYKQELSEGEYNNLLCKSNVENVNDCINHAKKVSDKEWEIDLQKYGLEALQETFELRDGLTEENSDEEQWKWYLNQKDDDSKTNREYLQQKIQKTYWDKVVNSDPSEYEFWNKVIKIHKKTLADKIKEVFGNIKDKLCDNSMGNMTLLHASLNDSIGNGPYSEKRDRIYLEYKKGTFVPLGTLLVFTNAYSNNQTAAFAYSENLWLPDSRLAYLKDMVDTIELFLGYKKDKKEEE